jgi:hypothetical protein
VHAERNESHVLSHVRNVIRQAEKGNWDGFNRLFRFPEGGLGFNKTTRIFNGSTFASAGGDVAKRTDAAVWINTANARTADLWGKDKALLGWDGADRAGLRAKRLAFRFLFKKFQNLELIQGATYKGPGRFLQRGGESIPIDGLQPWEEVPTKAAIMANKAGAAIRIRADTVQSEELAEFAFMLEDALTEEGRLTATLGPNDTGPGMPPRMRTPGAPGARQPLNLSAAMRPRLTTGLSVVSFAFHAYNDGVLQTAASAGTGFGILGAAKSIEVGAGRYAAWEAAPTLSRVAAGNTARLVRFGFSALDKIALPLLAADIGWQTGTVINRNMGKDNRTFLSSMMSYYWRTAWYPTFGDPNNQYDPTVSTDSVNDLHW